MEYSKYKLIKLLFIPFLVSPLFFSCQTTSGLKKKFHAIETNLYYELSTSVYEDEIVNTVLLNPIAESQMPAWMDVERKRYIIVPLLLYNYVNEHFKLTLGEFVFDNRYSDFLTDALLAECNRSTCFNLEYSPDSLDFVPEYVLEVKILRNETTSRLKLSDNFFVIPSGDFENISFSSYTYDSPSTKMSILASFSKDSESLFEKEFTVDIGMPERSRSFHDMDSANESCVRNMAECLSLATKQIVEQISAYLHLYLFASQKDKEG